MGRAALLAREDRDLIEAIFVRRQTARSLGRLMGLSPKVIRQRTRRLSSRLASRRFVNAARTLPYLAPDDAKLARLHFCQGLNQRQLSLHLGLSTHVLRRRLDRISAQIDTIRRVRHPELLKHVNEELSRQGR